MRITTQALGMTVVRNLNDIRKNVNRLQIDLATGVTVRQASDGPTKAAMSMRVSSALEQNDRYATTVNFAQSWLGVTDTALGQMGEVLQRAHTLVLQAKNGSNPDAARQAVADELEQLRDQLLVLGNQEHAGSYLFGGQRTQTQPYGYDPASAAGPNRPVVSLDDNGLPLTAGATHEPLRREISPGQQLVISFTEDQLQLNDAFTTLQQVVTTLRSGSGPVPLGGVDLDAALGQLDTQMDTLLSRRAETGAKINRLELLQVRFRENTLNLETLQSETIGTDMERAVIDLSVQDAAYNTALSVAGRIIPRSLVDYLR